MRYRVEVFDGFSATLQKFQTEVNAAKAAFASFKNVVGAGGQISASFRTATNATQTFSAAQANAVSAVSQFTDAQLQDLGVQRDRIRGLRKLASEVRSSTDAEEADAEALSRGIVTKRLAVVEARRLRDEARKRRDAERQAAAEAKATAKAERDAAKQIRADNNRRLRDTKELIRGRQDAARILQRDNAETLRIVNEQGKALRQQGEIENLLGQSRRARAQRLNQALLRQQQITQTVGARTTGVILQQADALDRTESAANRISFTFRRLIGILAAFAIARQAVAGFAALVATGFRFNQVLEQSRLGLAAIIVATSRVADEQGKVLGLSEAYGRALQLASRQQDELRQDALSTTATFEELLNVFQIATGPGLAAGLNLDQVRELSVLVSQAASVIGLEQRQLSEEVRALLSGRIRPGQTRIAEVLNITPDDIRNAKLQGDLFGFLQERLAGFALGAQEAARTVGGLFQRLNDAVQLSAGRAASQAFGDLRDTLRELFDTITEKEISQFGRLIVTPDPRVVQVFRAIFDAIQNVLSSVRDLAFNVGFDSLIGAAQLFGQALEFAGNILASVVAGAIRGFSTLGTILSPVIDVLNAFGSVGGNELLATITQVAVVALGLQISFGLVVGLFGKAGLALRVVQRIALRLTFLFGNTLARIGLMVTAMKDFLTQSRAVAVVMNVIRSRAFLIAGAFGVSLLVFKKITEAILGVSLSFSDFGEIVGSIVEKTLTQIGSLGTFIVNFLVAQFNIGSAKIKQIVGNVIEDVKALFDLELGASDDLSRLAAAEREDAKRLRAAKFEASKASAELDIQLAKEVLDQQLADAEKEKNRRIAAITARAQALQDIEDIEKRIAEIGAGGTGEDETELLARLRALRDEELLGVRQAEQRNALDLIQLDLNRQLASIEFSRGSQQSKDLASTKARVESLRQELARVRLDPDVVFQVRELQRALEDAEDTRDAAAVEFIKRQIAALTTEQLLKEEGISLELARQEQILKRQQLVAEGSFGEGFLEGLASFGDNIGTAFEAGVEIAKQALQGLADFASTTIVDAFDPSKGTDSIKENFAKLLQDLARQLLQSFFLQLLASLFSGGGGLPSNNELLDVAGGFTKWEGGPVPGRGGVASPAHVLRPRGLHTGGPTLGRPKGLHPQDTIPIWAAPGEFMMRVAAVRKYGMNVMAKLNAGLLDPGSLQSLAASAGGRAKTLRPRGGFQTGGSVTQTSSSAGGSLPGASPTVLPVFPVNENEMEKLVAGGAPALRKFMRDNSDETALGRRRR